MMGTGTAVGAVGADQLRIAGMTVTNDGTKTTFLGKTGDYNRIGDATTTNHSLDSEDDLMVTGDFEVDGTSFLDATTVVGLLTVNGSIQDVSGNMDLRAANANGVSLGFQARNNDIGLVDVAELQGAADPHFAIESQEDGRHLAFRYAGIEITNLKVIKVTKAHDSDLFDAGATTDNAVIWTQPANSKLIAAMMRLETQFAGTGPWSDLRVTLGNTGDNNGLLVTTGNMVTDSVDTEYEDVGAYYDTFTEGVHGKTTAAQDWTGYATSTGGNLSVSSAGTMDFYFLYEAPTG